MRTLLCVIAALAFAATASAGNLVPDDAIGWAAPWGNPANIVDHGDGTFTAAVGGNGSAGIFWRLPAWESEMVSVEGMWAGMVGNQNGWAEVMMFTCTEGMSDGDIAARIDAGNVAGDIVVKKDGWGLNTPPLVWGMEDIRLAALEPLEIHATCNEVVIAVKAGNVATLTYDISYVPEPAAALLLGLPMLLVRRRR